MNHRNEENPAWEEEERAAVEWTLRIDRGLTASEQDQFAEWIAADPSRREAMRLYQWGWDEFDRLAGLQTTRQAQADPDLLAPPKGAGAALAKLRGGRLWSAAVPLAAAAAAAFLSLLFWPSGEEEASLGRAAAPELISRIEQRTFPDGTRVDLNRGAAIETAFSDAERRVRLEVGEANFDVEPDPSRPFVVEAGSVDVQAVGTVFNVRAARERVDVIVSEGKVEVTASKGRDAPYGAPQAALLELRQRAVISLRGGLPEIEVATLSEEELNEELRWQPRLLDFDAAPLPQIVEEFNRRNPVRLVLADPALESVTLSSAFWSDNVEGFVRLMETSFGMEAEWRGPDEIVLRRSRARGLAR